MFRLSQLLVAIPLFSGTTWANDGAFLDPKYPKLPHLMKLKPGVKPFSFKYPKNDVLKLVSMQTPVKSQASRGTCSIFASTAMIESMLIIEKGFDPNIDLSEEYLEYLAMQGSLTDGSSSTNNFFKIASYGLPLEVTLPYIGETWDKLEYSELSKDRCQHLKDSFLLQSCLLGHRDPQLLKASDTDLHKADPEFYKARLEADGLKNKYLQQIDSGYYVSSVDEVKKFLKQGIPLTLDVDFYYGAWNHRISEELGITRDMDHWVRGIVGYPEKGSKDIEMSPKKPAGHSVLLVGYDDNAVVEVKTMMSNGSTKIFKYKGVYYFKNSWGTGNFGPQTTIDGQVVPGYGVITEKYADEFGAFFRLPLH